MESYAILELLSK